MRNTLNNLLGFVSNRSQEQGSSNSGSARNRQGGINPPEADRQIFRATPYSTPGAVSRASSVSESGLSLEAQNALQATITPSLAVLPSVTQNHTEVVNLSLQNLRIGTEPDSNLVNIPSCRTVQLPDLTPPPDDQTAGLTGRAYLEALGRDERLPVGLRTLCRGPKLAASRSLTDQQIDHYSEKTRFIASRCHSGSDEFNSQINDLAIEAQVFCGDRTAYFIEQMHGMAILDLLSHSGTMDEAMLFNLGVAYYKLDLVKIETCKRMTNAVNQHETVEDVLIAEYLLQHELGLPVSHDRPGFMGVGNMTPEIADEIKQAVITRLLSKDGVYVIDFLSEWEPWSKYVENLPENRADFEKLHEVYATNLQTHLAKPYIPESVKVEHAEDCMDRYRNWKRELVGQKSREYLINYRADFLIEQGYLPGPLASEVTR